MHLSTNCHVGHLWGGGCETPGDSNSRLHSASNELSDCTLNASIPKPRSRFSRLSVMHPYRSSGNPSSLNVSQTMEAYLYCTNPITWVKGYQCYSRVTGSSSGVLGVTPGVKPGHRVDITLSVCELQIWQADITAGCRRRMGTLLFALMEASVCLWLIKSTCACKCEGHVYL